LIKIIEVVLFGAILIHIFYGIWIQIQNWLSRPVGYTSGNKSEVSFFSRFMIWTGAVVFTFLVLHFFNFYFIRLGIVKGNPEDFYSIAHNLFKIPAYNLIYLGCFILLGFHFYHAFYSAFQTLGLNHRIWSPIVKIIALFYAVIIPAGFAFISITLWLLR
jgi:succinate dehydrogenase / fumarate reductase cytochrome b subunit